MLSWWTENFALAHFKNILDIATEVVPAYSVYKAPLNEVSFGLLAPIFAKLAYSNMLFILELACTACSPAPG